MIVGLVKETRSGEHRIGLTWTASWPFARPATA